MFELRDKILYIAFLYMLDFEIYFLKQKYYSIHFSQTHFLFRKYSAAIFVYLHLLKHDLYKKNI